jgi:putative ABC transport system ATP-binding protein
MPNQNIFDLKNVAFSVAELNILKDISLTIHKNDFMVLLGPSGSGKSTLLRLLNGLNSPTAGEIQFHSEDIFNTNPKELRKKVGMVFQSPVMVNGTVKDNLTIMQKWDKRMEDITEPELVIILEQVGLSATFLDKEAKSLSGGEQQRIALARVLLNKPEVLLLDEPTSNLDPQLAVKILKLICEISKKLDLTVVLVTHHHNTIEKYARQVLFMIEGKIVESGNRSIIKNPKSTAAQAFIAEESK